ncbi:MAG TPA: hypothetical protein VF157_07330 [Chloroflexota bacterium]
MGATATGADVGVAGGLEAAVGMLGAGEELACTGAAGLLLDRATADGCAAGGDSAAGLGATCGGAGVADAAAAAPGASAGAT